MQTWDFFESRVEFSVRIMSQESCCQPVSQPPHFKSVCGHMQLFKVPCQSLLFILRVRSTPSSPLPCLKWNVKSQISMSIHGWGSGASAPTFEYFKKASKSGEISWLSDCKITGSCRGRATLTPQPSETQRVKVASGNYSSPRLRLRDAAMAQKICTIIAAGEVCDAGTTRTAEWRSLQIQVPSSPGLQNSRPPGTLGIESTC